MGTACILAPEVPSPRRGRPPAGRGGGSPLQGELAAFGFAAAKCPRRSQGRDVACPRFPGLPFVGKSGLAKSSKTYATHAQIQQHWRN